ncbi:MAG: tRNA (N6-isopentenyl adenosine(37)-C2)-methylthiotransferase MiaB [Victivallales bacterium]|nr:tRNA (N6-isopentenyl adenosine(37)-C2)-methylthiotransferase MiaB [Victivallales bacterium]
MSQSFYLRTYGCQMNARDSEAVTAAMVAAGFAVAPDENGADILLFNTCSVRDQAERKALGKIGILKSLKRERPERIFGVMGCMAQNLGEKLVKDLPHVDFVLGTDQMHRLPEVVNKLLEKRDKLVFVERGDNGDFRGLLQGHRAHREPGGESCSAFVALMRGCNRHCSYCIVPHVRGIERSRPAQEIIDECERLADAGVKELMLLGQNIAAYGLDGSRQVTGPGVSPFAELLRMIDAVKGIERIRFTSPHPLFFNDSLIEAATSLPKVCENIHLPVQSGSDRILDMMNRGYSRKGYMDIVGKLRSRSPGITFSTDVIVGFPTETAGDFEDTRSLLNEVAFDNSFIFKYSPRTGTSAAKMTDDVPKKIKEERNAILLSDLKQRVAMHNQRLEGSVLEVIAEGPSKRDSSRWCGRSRTNKVMVFQNSPDMSVGDFVDVLVKRSTFATLFGVVSMPGRDDMAPQT